MKAMQVLKNKKGFTLIEIIVVLIILAILAAAGIPSMLGFIEDSRAKALIAEARVGFVAAQVIVTETDTASVDTSVATGTRFQQLISGVTTAGGFSNVKFSGKEVIGIIYKSGGYEVQIDTVTPALNYAGKVRP